MSTDRSKPDLIFVNLVHQALRVDGERLIATVAALQPSDREDRVPGVRAYYDQYRQQLVAHHTHEDTVFFPALAAKVGDERMHRHELVSQHHELDHVLESIGEGFEALATSNGDHSESRDRVGADLATMSDHLTAHLDLEERTVLPLIQSEIPVKEFKGLETTVRRATPRDQTAFLIPWMAEHATPEQRRSWFRSAPPLRIIYRLNRGRYRRSSAYLRSSRDH